MSKQWRGNEMSEGAQKLLNPVFAQVNPCPFCSIIKLKAEYCDCPEGEKAWQKLAHPTNSKGKES